MKACGIRLRSFCSTAPRALLLIGMAAIYVSAIIGCGTGGNTYSPVVRSNQAGFSIAVTPGSVGVVAGNTANYTVSITETGGFNSPITLSASGLPSGSTATFGELTATAFGATATLSIATSSTEEEAAVVLKSKLAGPAAGSPATRQVTPIGSTLFTVTGTGGGITQTSNTVTLVVTQMPDFTVTLAPATAGSNIVAPGGVATYIATLTSIAGFSSPVTLSLSGNPQYTTISFGSTTVTPTAAGATTTVNIATEDDQVTPFGNDTLTLTGTTSQTIHMASASLMVGSFSVTVTEASPGSGTVVQGGTAHYIITLTSNFGFAPLVTLSTFGLPTGCTATFGSSTLTPTTAGATTTFNITTTGIGSATTTPEITNFTFNVSGQGGGWQAYGSSLLTVTLEPLG